MEKTLFMKIILTLTVVSIILAVNTASAEPNLLGTWSFKQDIIHSDGTIETNYSEEFIIDLQDESLFSGCAWNGDPLNPPARGQYFSGVIDGKNIVIIHHDGISRGNLGKNEKTITFINQVFGVDDHTSYAGIGTAVKDNETYPVCPPLPPLP